MLFSHTISISMQVATYKLLLPSVIYSLFSFSLLHLIALYDDDDMLQADAIDNFIFIIVRRGIIN